MAWALRDDASNTAGAISFNRDSLSDTPGMTIVEIADDLAMAVLTGQRSMAHVWQDPPPLVPITDEWLGYTDSYPAMMSDRDVRALAKLAKLLPANAVVVEVGSRLGGSARIMADNAADIHCLYCIDVEWSLPDSPGMQDPAMQRMSPRWRMEDHNSCYAFARSYLGDLPFVSLIPTDSPGGVGWLGDPVDMVYEDSNHHNPHFERNLRHWLPRIRPGGIMAGHDYSRNWRDVVSTVDAIAAERGAELHVDGTVWWFIV